MAKQTIDLGTSPDDGEGDEIRTAFDKCNDNFTELYDEDTALDGRVTALEGAPPGSVASLDDVGDVNAPSPNDGDVLAWDATPGEWVPQAPTGGSNALDDLTDVDAPTPSDGDVLTFDSGSGDWVPEAPGGGADWAPAGGAYTSPGVWDQAVDGNAANIDFTGLSGATDIRLIMEAVTKANSGAPVVYVSIDNGSNWYTTSGDYAFASTAGVRTNADSMAQFHITNATAARDGIVEIQNANKPRPVGLNVTVQASHRLFLASTSPINAVRIVNPAGGNFTGGKFYCLVR